MMDIMHHHPYIFWTTVIVFGIVVGYVALLLWCLNELGGMFVKTVEGMFWRR